MRPFSDTTPKVLLDICGKPLFAYRIDELASGGISNITIVCSRDTITKIAAYAEQTYPHLDIECVVQAEPLGVAHAIETASASLRGKQVLLLLGDNLSVQPVTQQLIAKVGGSQTSGAVAVRHVDNPSQFGVVRVADDRIIEIVEKPLQPPSSLVATGTALLDGDILLQQMAARGYTMQTADGKREISAPQYLIAAGYRLAYLELQSDILDVGRPQDLLSAVAMVVGDSAPWLGNVDENTDIDPSVYVGPRAVIAAGACIQGACHIDGTVGEGAHIKDSMIMQGATVEPHARVERSVIGEGARIVAGVEISAETVPVTVQGQSYDAGAVGMFVGSGVVVHESRPGATVTSEE